MKEEHANQIAELLNTRNELTKQYYSDDILNDSENYLYELRIFSFA
jgi:hypothetical protein